MTRNTIFIFLIRFCLLLITIFGYVYYSRTLDVSTYGIYVKTILVSLPIFLAIGTFGAGSTLYNYNKEGLIYQIRQLPLSKWAVILGYGILISIIFGTVVCYISVITFQYIWLLALFLLCQLVAMLWDNIGIILGKNVALTIINIVYAASVMYAHVNIIEQGSFSIIALCQIWIWLLLGKIVLVTIYIFKDFMSSHHAITLVQMPTKKTWIGLGINDMLQIFLRQVDKLIIAIGSSSAAAAVYFNGRLEIPILPSILSAVKSAALIQLTRTNEVPEKILQVVHYSFKILAALTIGIMIWALVYKEEMITYVLGDTYIASIPFLTITLLTLPSQYCIAITYILQYKQRVRIINKSVIYELILVILFMLPLYALMGTIGIAWSVCISSYLVAIYLLYMTGKVTRTYFLRFLPWKYYAGIIVTNTLVALGSYFILKGKCSDIVLIFTGTILGMILLAIHLKIAFQSQKNKHLS